MYTLITGPIAVSVEPRFLDEQSAPEEGHFVWTYRVRIENRGTYAVTLRNRHWAIINAAGIVQETSGSGVVGVEPIILPGETFEYTGGTPLSTPSGIMIGRYMMQAETGEVFDIDVPAFSLDSPYDAATVN
ncbi:MAG: Co2+/Mg2+ efflux protein ApaG [Pseudomonadota bacterium]|nr:Co2+/Mg2+ efflux protein ApaG [Pseudomonadota bacterium]